MLRQGFSNDNSNNPGANFTFDSLIEPAQDFNTDSQVQTNAHTPIPVEPNSNPNNDISDRTPDFSDLLGNENIGNNNAVIETLNQIVQQLMKIQMKRISNRF